LKAGAVSAFQVAQARNALNQVQLAIGGAERQARVCVNGRLVRFAQRSGYRADTFVISVIF